MIARVWLGVILAASGVAACATTPAPAGPSAPRYVDVPVLEVPGPLAGATGARLRHDAGWARFQAGDLRGATREFTAALAAAPGFYPSEAGLGYVAFYDKRWDDAAKWFDAALSRDGGYVPALSGRVETALSAGDDRAAIRVLELWLQVAAGDVEREALHSRLDVLRLRAVQAELAQAATAREGGRLDDAQAALDRAREMSPDSGVVLRELARVEAARGAFDAAETHARRAVTLDPGDAEAHTVLGDVLEAHGRLREAAAAFARAAGIDPRPEWQRRAADISSRAEFNALPAEFRAIPEAQTITRGQLAALLGSRLQGPLERVPRRVPVVLTDVRGHWAASWILPVTRAGVMEPLPNHTFQPGAIVRRAELAQIVWQAIQMLGAHRQGEVGRWRTARLLVSDVPSTHLAFEAIAAAVASGTMSLVDETRFQPGRPVSGPEAIAAVARLEQIAQGGGR